MENRLTLTEINFICKRLHDASAELYESFFDEYGEIKNSYDEDTLNNALDIIKQMEEIVDNTQE